MAPKARAFDSNGTTIIIEDLPDGDFLVRLKFGPISMVATLPRALLPAMFPENPEPNA